MAGLKFTVSGYLMIPLRSQLSSSRSWRSATMSGPATARRPSWPGQTISPGTTTGFQGSRRLRLLQEAQILARATAYFAMAQLPPAIYSVSLDQHPATPMVAPWLCAFLQRLIATERSRFGLSAGDIDRRSKQNPNMGWLQGQWQAYVSTRRAASRIHSPLPGSHPSRSE